MSAPTAKPNPRLVLFDVDGTLMITKGASSRCMKRAAQSVLGPTFEWSPITVGTLDPQIFEQLATANNITATPEQIRQYEQAYLQELEAELKEKQDDIVVMPGIEHILQLLHDRATTHEDIILGVLTGNFRRATELKLTISGIGLERFAILTCAEDGQTRDDLPRAAMQTAAQQCGRAIDPGSTFILGDTPRDIQCAHANGCIPIAIATGHYDMDQLKEAGGQIVVQSLEDPAPLLDQLQLS